MMTLSSIPSPSISSFSIGPFTIRFYALCILTGIALAVWIATRRWKRMGGSFDQVLDITLCSVPAGIIGARLYHIITTPERFFGPQGDWTEMFRIWNGGLGIWGGVLFGALAAWAWCRFKHYPMALLADAIAPALLVAQAVGRLGNWFNKELYGSATTSPWGLSVDDSGVLYHPTFLYELLWNLIGAALIVWIGNKALQRLAPGSLFTIYIMWYTAGRTWIEALRIDYAHQFLGVRINVWVSMGVFVLGAIAFIVLQRSNQSRAELQRRLVAVTSAEIQRQAEQATPRQSQTAAPSDASSEHLEAVEDEQTAERHAERRQHNA